MINYILMMAVVVGTNYYDPHNFYSHLKVDKNPLKKIEKIVYLQSSWLVANFQSYKKGNIFLLSFWKKCYPQLTEY